MNASFFHLALSHFPVILPVVGIALLGYGLMSKNITLQKAGLIVFVFCALFAIPVYITGEDAGNSIRSLHDVSNNAISLHEEIAEKAIWIIGLMGAISLMALVYAFRHRNIRILCIVIITIALISLIMTGWVGHTGGLIRHTELL